MPIPDFRNSVAFAHVWTGNLDVTGKTPIGAVSGPIRSRRFITYVEVVEQGAHDAIMRNLTRQRAMEPRHMHLGRVNPNNTVQNGLNYYVEHGQMAARLVGIEMTAKWEKNNQNNRVFARGEKHQLGVQKTQQDNGHCYEITMWYDVSDIYVAFHCYDPNFTYKRGASN